MLPIPVGARVRFPNNDPILHNVFSTAKEASFDLGLYGRSDGENYRFSQPGVIRVYCNVHHAMVAHVLVMDTPFFTKPDAQGRFRLVGVPAEPAATLGGVRHALASGGAAIIKVPNYASLNRHVMGRRWCGFRWPDHVNYFTPASLERLVRQAGLEVARFTPLDDAHA